MTTKNKMRFASIFALILWGFVWASVILNQPLNGLTAIICIVSYPAVYMIQFKLYRTLDPLFLFIGDAHKKFD